jgi:predicted HTH domain antitoxin
MTALTLAIPPDSTLSALRRSPTELDREMKLASAIHWYSRGLMSQEPAAELAGMNRRNFIRALVREGFDVSKSFTTRVSRGSSARPRAERLPRYERGRHTAKKLA